MYYKLNVQSLLNRKRLRQLEGKCYDYCWQILELQSGVNKLAQSAYIKLVEGSAMESITLDEVQQKLERYINLMSRTGKQLSWQYSEAAFPYTIETKPESKGTWFYLKGKDKLYNYLIFGVGKETYEVEEDKPKEESNEEESVTVTKERYYIQVVLPDGATHGDKAKGNELCKFLAKELKAELHLFNGRIMYFNPRK